MTFETDQGARLRTIIVADTLVTAGGSLFTIAMAVFVAESELLLVVGCFVGAVAVAMAYALRPLNRGRPSTALAWLAAANWTVSLVNATIATFSWPLMMSSALLPAAIAVSFVRRRELMWYVVISVIAATLVACVGLLQDVSGLSGDIDDWLENLVLLLFAPALAALIMLSAFQSSIRLHGALDESLLAHVALADRADQLRRSRARLVAATDRERRRIERDLHDGAQSRLIAINLRLAKARRLVRVDPAAADLALGELRQELQLAQAELRDLAHGVYPTVLTRHGLAPAIQAVADRSPVATRFDATGVGRHSSDVEAAFYFCILEAIQNASKHAHATSVEVRLEQDERWLRFDVTDRGVGFRLDDANGAGIDNMRDRLGSVGGRLTIESAPSRGTSVRGQIEIDATSDSAVGDPG